MGLSWQDSDTDTSGGLDSLVDDYDDDNSKEELAEVEDKVADESDDESNYADERKHLDYSLKGSVLGTFIEHRMNENRDVKMIVTSKGSTTGLGKSTFAICAGRWSENYLTDRLWRCEDRGYIDIQEYISKYKSCPEYTSLIIDEIEHGADSRRSMAQDNVDLSHAWAQLRYRNVISIATLPSVSMLDNRMMELADIWVNVLEKGKAIAFYIWVNDFTGKVHKKQLTHPVTGQPEILTWPDLSGDVDYEYLTNLKDQHVRTGESAQMYTKEQVDEKVQKAKKDKRDELIRSFYNSEYTSISQSKLGEIVDLSQSSIGVIVNDDE